MSKWWEYKKEHNTYCLYCNAFPREWGCRERRPIAVLHVERKCKKERYTYDCCVVFTPGYSIPLRAKSIDGAKSKIEKEIIEYLKYKINEHLVGIRILNKELEDLKGEENEVCKM